jgi:hypothetical protein
VGGRGNHMGLLEKKNTNCPLGTYVAVAELATKCGGAILLVMNLIYLPLSICQKKDKILNLVKIKLS